MSTQPAHDRAAHAAFLSRLTCYVREHPGEFQRGAELLERYFSVAACRKREAHEARAFRRAYARGNPIWTDTLERLRGHNTPAARESAAMRLSLAAAERWVRDGEDAMQRDEAEAVCLVVVCTYDDNPKPNAALPPTLRPIPWGRMSDDTHEHQPGRWFRAFSLGMDATLLERARIAWARIESWGPPAPTTKKSKRAAELHDGHRRAFAAYRELEKLAPHLKNARQRDQYVALCAFHKAGSLKAYAGVKLPDASSFWKYVRDVRKASRKPRPDLPA